MARRATRSALRLLEQHAFFEDLHKTLGRQSFRGFSQAAGNVEAVVNGFGRVVSISNPGPRVSDEDRISSVNEALYQAHIASVEARQRAYRHIIPKVTHTTSDSLPFALAHSVFPSPVTACFANPPQHKNYKFHVPLRYAVSSAPSSRAHMAVLSLLRESGKGLTESDFAVSPHTYPPSHLSFSAAVSLPGTLPGEDNAPPSSGDTAPPALHPTHRRDVHVARLVTALATTLADATLAKQTDRGQDRIMSAVDAFVELVARDPLLASAGVESAAPNMHKPAVPKSSDGTASASPRAPPPGGRTTVAAAVAANLRNDLAAGVKAVAAFQLDASKASQAAQDRASSCTRGSLEGELM